MWEPYLRRRAIRYLSLGIPSVDGAGQTSDLDDSPTLVRGEHPLDVGVGAGWEPLPFFYEALGATQVSERSIKIGGTALTEVAYAGPILAL